VQHSQQQLDVQLAAAVRAAREEIMGNYSVVVDTTNWSWCNGELQVQGGVLSPVQMNIYQRVLGEQLGDLAIPEPAILSSLDSPWHLHQWLQIPAGNSLDLFRRPNTDLQTQWAGPAWVRYFADHPNSGSVLIQTPDASLGWTSKDQLACDATGPTADPWAHYLRPLAHRTRAPQVESPCNCPRMQANEVLACYARSWLGRSYGWGANSERRIDCSGFTQRVMLHCCGLLLPKNSADQQALGKHLGPDEMRAGDLVFVVGRSEGLRHVAMVVEAPNDPTSLNVVHASMSKSAVVEERLDVFLARHEFKAARRLLHWPEER
tara:strand:+ start:302 stop:1261 length:960 start_codon:yes stop_codon:yes gene_type:complete